ncbi:MAG TPA: hypothetical protein VMH33_00995 [Solirubrobacterales bacterium]|nr:hypothetical protein [Solirubrobacterales bacterium]
MNRRKADVLAWESRWSVPVGLATFAAVLILIVSTVVIADVNGSGEAELLTAAYEHASSVTISSILEAIGFLILAAPLYFLFRAALVRSSGRMKSQLVGVIVVAPLFFAISGVLNGIATKEAADSFTKGEAKSTLSAEKGAEECREEEREKGAKEFGEKWESGASPLKDCEATEQEESAAENALSESSFRDAATGFGLAGRIGLAVALVYSCLWAMRIGLLSRFWGALGIALGVAALLLLVQFCLIFFIYFALLLVGKLPGGRPSAWAAGEAVPWPTAGERIAKEIEPKDGGPEPDGDVIDTTAADLPEGTEAPEPEEAPEPDGDGSSPGGGSEGPQKRKRKRRS